MLMSFTSETLPAVPQSVTSADSSLSDADISAPLSEEEISGVITKLHPRKAGGISLEMLRLNGADTVHWLNSISDTIWATETSQVLVPLHKKESQAICDNYRGIALLRIPSNVFAKTTLN